MYSQSEPKLDPEFEEKLNSLLAEHYLQSIPTTQTARLNRLSVELQIKQLFAEYPSFLMRQIFGGKVV